MKKQAFKAIYKEAMNNHAAYIGVKISIEGLAAPEVVINPNANFEHKLSYYSAAYDDDMVLKALAGKKDINVIDIAYGDSFADINYLLNEDTTYWKKLISKTIDKVVERELRNNPQLEEDMTANIRLMLEGVKQSFIENKYTPSQQRFIIENIEIWEDMFECCMNGNDLEFKKKFAYLSKKLSEAR